MKEKSDLIKPICIGCDDLSKNVEFTGIVSERVTSLQRFIYSTMKNNYFPGNQDYTCADTGLIAMLDIIKSTRNNCVSNLKLNDKGSFFHLSDIGKTKNLTDTFYMKGRCSK